MSVEQRSQQSSTNAVLLQNEQIRQLFNELVRHSAGLPPDEIRRRYGELLLYTLRLAEKLGVGLHI